MLDIAVRWAAQDIPDWDQLMTLVGLPPKDIESINITDEDPRDWSIEEWVNPTFGRKDWLYIRRNGKWILGWQDNNESHLIGDHLRWVVDTWVAVVTYAWANPWPLPATQTKTIKFYNLSGEVV